MEKYRGKKSPDGIKWSNLIIQKIISASKRCDIQKIWLWTTHDNISAIQLYKKFNFVQEKIPDKLKNKIHKKYNWTINKTLIFMKNY